MKRLILFLLLNMFSLCLSAGSLHSSTDRTSIDKSETLTLTIQYNENTDKEPDTQQLEQQFSVIGRYKSSNIQIINGDITTNTSWQYELSPLKTGSLSIPIFTINGDSSEPIVIEVTEKTGEANASAQKNIYSETLLDKENVFVQQQAIITWRLVSRYNIIDPQFSPPKIDGVLMQDLGSRAYQRSSAEGFVERIIEQSYALFPQKSGVINIPSQQFQLVIDTPQRTNKGYFRAQRSQIRITTDEKSITVEPGNNPNGTIWLPAASLSVSQQLIGTGSNHSVTVGTAFTRVIRISADGLSAEQLPPVNFQADNIKAYSEKPLLENQTSASSLTGIREDRAAIIATRPGKLVLPAISIPWYNINNHSWQTATIPELVLDVAPATGSSTADGSSTFISEEADTTSSAPDSSSAVNSDNNNEDSTSKISTPTTNTGAMNSDRFWQMITAILTILLIVMAMLFFKQRNRLNDSRNLSETLSPRTSGSQSLSKAIAGSDIKMLHREILFWANNAPEHRELLHHPSIAPVLQALEKHLYGNAPLPDINALRKLPEQLEALAADSRKETLKPQLEDLYR